MTPEESERFSPHEIHRVLARVVALAQDVMVRETYGDFGGHRSGLKTPEIERQWLEIHKSLFGDKAERRPENDTLRTGKGRGVPARIEPLLELADLYVATVERSRDARVALYLDWLWTHIGVRRTPARIRRAISDQEDLSKEEQKGRGHAFVESLAITHAELGLPVELGGDSIVKSEDLRRLARVLRERSMESGAMPAHRFWQYKRRRESADYDQTRKGAVRLVELLSECRNQEQAQDTLRYSEAIEPEDRTLVAYLCQEQARRGDLPIVHRTEPLEPLDFPVCEECEGVAQVPDEAGEPEPCPECSAWEAKAPESRVVEASMDLARAFAIVDGLDPDRTEARVGWRVALQESERAWRG